MNPNTQLTPSVDQLKATRVTERNNIFIPNVLPPRLGSELLELCKDPEIAHLFLQAKNMEADVDKLELIDKHILVFEEIPALNRMRQIAQNPLTQRALIAAFDLDQLSILSLSIIRMGPGCFNYNHTHGVHTANILLQDNPRRPGSQDGIYFTSAFLKEGETRDPDRRTGQMTYAYDHEPILFGMHARVAGVGHGVHKINGDESRRADPDICRYVLTYVLPKIR